MSETVKLRVIVEIGDVSVEQSLDVGATEPWSTRHAYVVRLAYDAAIEHVARATVARLMATHEPSPSESEVRP